VKNGVVVPNAPLPEGALVEIHCNAGRLEVPEELQAEFDGWDRASDETLQLVERLVLKDQSKRMGENSDER
jgi:hypothetical protein